MDADAHLRTDPQLAKTSGGEQRAHVSPDSDATFRPRMPVGEQTARGSLGTIFYPARPTARYAGGQLWVSFADSSPGGVCLFASVSRIRCRRENFSLRPFGEESAVQGEQGQQPYREHEPKGYVICASCQSLADSEKRRVTHGVRIEPQVDAERESRQISRVDVA